MMKSSFSIPPGILKPLDIVPELSDQSIACGRAYFLLPDMYVEGLAMLDRLGLLGLISIDSPY
jgi:hypothetical protein